MTKPKKKNPLAKIFKTKAKDEFLSDSKKINVTGYGTPARKSKNGWFGIKKGGPGNNKDADATFMTAETEGSGEEISQNGRLGFFPEFHGSIFTADAKPGLKVAAIPDFSPTSLEREMLLLQPKSWKDVVSESDGNLEIGLNSAAVTLDQNFVADFQSATQTGEIFSGMDFVPFDDPSSHTFRNPVPDTVDFEDQHDGAASVVSEFGLDSAYVSSVGPFATTFPSWEVSADAPGFLSAEEELTLGNADCGGMEIADNSLEFLTSERTGITGSTMSGQFDDADDSIGSPSIKAKIEYSSEALLRLQGAPNEGFKSNHSIPLPGSTTISTSASHRSRVRPNPDIKKSKRTLSTLVGRDQANLKAKLKNNELGDQGSADVSSAFTKSLDGRSHRSNSSGEQTLKSANTYQQMAMHKKDAPGTYAHGKELEIGRSSSDSLARQKPADYRLIEYQPKLQRASTAPSDRTAASISIQETSDAEEDASDGHPTASFAVYSGFPNSNACTDIHDSFNTDKKIVDELDEVEWDNDDEEEVHWQKNEDFENRNQSLSNPHQKALSEAGSAATEQIRNGLSSGQLHGAISHTSQTATLVRNNYRKLCAKLVQDCVEDRKMRRPNRQLIPPGNSSESDGENQSIGDRDEVELKPSEEGLPSSPETTSSVDSAYPATESTEDVHDPDIVDIASDDEEELKDKILQPSFDDGEDIVNMSEQPRKSKHLSFQKSVQVLSSKGSPTEDATYRSNHDHSVEASRRYSKRRNNAGGWRERSRGELMPTNERKSNCKSNSKSQRDDDRSVVTGATGASTLSFIKGLDMKVLDRFTDELNCSLFAAPKSRDDDSGSDEADEEAYDEESALSSDDDSFSEEYDRRRRKSRIGSRIEEEVEEALEWADKNLVFCNTRC